MLSSVTCVDTNSSLTEKKVDRDPLRRDLTLTLVMVGNSAAQGSSTVLSGYSSFNLLNSSTFLPLYA